MPPKSKKISAWAKCESCSIDIPSKDIKSHLVSGCPSESNSWISPYISRGNLYTYLDAKECEEHNTIARKLQNNVIFINQTAIQTAGFVIGELVIVESQCKTLPTFSRRVWPIQSTDLTTALLPEKCKEFGWFGRDHHKVSIKKLTLPQLAAAVHVEIPNNENITGNLLFMKHVQQSFIDKVISSPSSNLVNFYGKDILIEMSKIVPSEVVEGGSDDIGWFLITDNTKWILNNPEKSLGITKNTICIGGVDKILDDIRSMLKLALHSNNEYSTNFNFMRSILLYGPSGTGKSIICKYIAYESNVNVVNINGPQIYSKFYGETEAALKKMFADAVINCPSIIIIDEIDTLCPKRSSTGTDQEKRILSTFSTLLDNLHEENSRVFILANTNKADMLDPSLRRYGRIDCELEVPVPDKIGRLDIFSKMLTNIPHKMSTQDIESVADAAHGYVGADIGNLCTQASMHMLKNKSLDSSPQVNIDDFEWALKQVKPSSMREVLIAIPNVKWSDIGGLNDLKQKLKQAIEWPIKYSESFSRLGIKAPSGLLMYGPPGCSKTMIAKALANESGLNFLSIKGPELFSKWVGESERAVRELFRKARQVAPAIIFFDEIDALGGERSKHNSGSNVQERVLAQILTELDGISPLGNVTVVAATNRPDKMDSALLRPGRLDRIVYVPLPDKDTRRAIFDLKLSKMSLAEDVNIDDLVDNTSRYSGAEVQAVCHEAALKALEENINCTEVSFSHFSYALQVIQPRTPHTLIALYEKFEKCYM